MGSPEEQTQAGDELGGVTTPSLAREREFQAFIDPMAELPAGTRVGFLIDRWQPSRGGAEGELSAFARYLVGKGVEVHAFGARGPQPGEDAPGTFHQVHAWRLGRVARERALGAAMVRGAKEAGCALTVGVRHLPAVDLLWMHGGAHLATLAAREGRHGVRPRRVTGRHRGFVEMERYLCEGAAARIAVPSEPVGDELYALYGDALRARLAIVRAGVDLERFHPRARRAARAALGFEVSFDPGVPRLAFTATNPELKGLPLLLRALQRLGDLPWQLVIAGVPRKDLVQAAVSRAGFAVGRVHVRGRLDPVTLAAGADLCVLPTRRDPFGLVVAEALAAGTPVITTSRAGAASWVAGPDCGEVFPDPDDAAALERALRTWIGRIRGGAAPEPDVVRAAAHTRDAGECHRELAALLSGLLPR